MKNKSRVTMTEERLNPSCILSTENNIARKLSFDETVREYVARKTRKRIFCNMHDVNNVYSHKCLPCLEVAKVDGHNPRLGHNPPGHNPRLGHNPPG